MSNGEHQDRIFLALMGASTAAAAAVVVILGLGWVSRAMTLCTTAAEEWCTTCGVRSNHNGGKWG